MSQIISQADVERFHRDGFLVVRQAIDPETLGRLRQVTDDLVDRSRSLTESDGSFELEDGHSSQTPRLRRINHPVAVDETFWELASGQRLLGVMTALLGPNLKFHHSKLNTKAGGGGAEIGWHQDFAFFPHTNFDLAACGIALDDSTAENGCLLVVPGSHKGPLLPHRLDDGRFVGKITRGLDSFDDSRAAPVELRAGDMSIHHAMTIHGSTQNNSTRPRRLLIFQYAATDAVQLDHRPPANAYSNRVLCGEPATHARLAGPVTLPLRGQITARSLFDTQRNLKTE